MRAEVTLIGYVLRFKSGEYFVGAADLHDTTFTADLAQATWWTNRADAETMRNAMLRTQGVQLDVSEVA